MSEFSVYIMSVVGAVCLSSLSDIILPDGETKKYVKGVLALIVFAIMITPVPKLVNQEFSLSDFVYEEQSDASSSSSINDVVRAEKIYTQKEELAVKLLEANGYSDVTVTILLSYEKKLPTADKVIVTLNLNGISQKNENIDIMSNVAEITATATGVSLDDIMVENLYEQD